MCFGETAACWRLTLQKAVSVSSFNRALRTPELWCAFAHPPAALTGASSKAHGFAGRLLT
jgi:hypothetical protein